MTTKQHEEMKDETFDDIVMELADERYQECYESCMQGGVPRDFTVDEFIEDAREFLMRAVAAHGRRPA